MSEGVFTAAEVDYLNSQRLGRLATQQPNGTLQVSPVGFQLEASTGTFVIHGFQMAASQKFRNVAANGKAAFVVDDLASTDPWRVRCVEIRGVAEAISSNDLTGGGLIRIHPRRIISFGIDEDRPPHEMQSSSRNVAP